MITALTFWALLATQAPPAAMASPASPDDADALAQSGTLLQLAERALLAGDGARALDILRREASTSGRAEAPDGREAGWDARRLRLELDALVVEGDFRAARARLEALSKVPGWAAHVRQQRVAIESRAWSREASDLALSAYALALSLLMLYAARELVTFPRDALAFGLAGGLAVGLVGLTSPSVGLALALVVMGLSALLHAAGAAFRRMAPGPRWRLILLVVLFLGAVGVTAAVLLRVEPAALWAAFTE